ncbi:cadherin-related family member 5-like [Conger conger]|uniref:cadherin-related family member 5-like n=1 Tax=Conger conger TaxID=82655 RepID=UPI002A5A01D9|nr:cadherin-related family member 5-like [Conger conger]
MFQLRGSEKWAMELKYKNSFSFNAILHLLPVFVLLRTCPAQQLCSVPPDPVTIKENHTIDIPIITINTIDGVTLILTDNPDNTFGLHGTSLMLMKIPDFETLKNEGDLTAHVQCDKTGFPSTLLPVTILVENVNDNPPGFAQRQYTLNVDELTPEDTSIGRIEATDRDTGPIYYHLEPATGGYFKIQTVNNPNILVEKVADYDDIQTLTLILYAQDTPTTTQTEEPSYTATTTITVNIRDIDNRPPWFQPCTESTVGTAKICLSSGYKGKVNLTEKEDGDLLLEPGPLSAVDGDKDRDEQISYKIVKGNEAGIFHVNENTGDMTMLKAANVEGPIILTVLASQVTNNDQFATTTVTFEVMKKSKYFPRFERERYEGYTSCDAALGSMLLADRTSNRPLRVWAKDADYANGLNPDVRYTFDDSSDFTTTAEGFVLLKKLLPQGIMPAKVLVAVDDSSGETAFSELTVHVLPEGALGPGKYRAEDMAALGASLAAMVVLCLVLICLLVFHMKKGNADWHKLTEGSLLCSSLAQGSGSPKEETHYTNDGFQNEGDPCPSAQSEPVGNAGSVGSKPAPEPDLRFPAEREPRAKETPPKDTYPPPPPPPPPAPYPDDSPVTSDRSVRPILAKERKSEDGSKSVWFKEDLHPSAKEEVLITPDGGDEGGDISPLASPLPSPKVFFTDAKTGDNAAVRFQDPGKNSDPETQAGVREGKREYL